MNNVEPLKSYHNYVEFSGTNCLAPINGSRPIAINGRSKIITKMDSVMLSIATRGKLGDGDYNTNEVILLQRHKSNYRRTFTTYWIEVETKGNFIDQDYLLYHECKNKANC